MPEIQEMRCKTCDATLDLRTAAGGVIECLFCHNTYTVPKEDAKVDTRELLAIAEHELDACTFDRAYTAYRKAAEIDAYEPEAYFGMALSEFKVQYLKDAEKKHLQPICHDLRSRKFSDDNNYLKALSLATAAQRAVYEQRAKEIDEVSEEFARLKNSGLRYDCFICVKVTDGGANTQDSYEALKLYNHLKSRGYSPFYSEVEIRNRAGARYEALILYALYTSECMLVVCSNDEYLQTPWVKNEYTRFMELINDERKDADSITIVFKGKPIERLPGKRALIQGVNLNNPDAYAVLETFVENHTPEARAMKEEAERRKAEENERLRQETQELKKRLEEQSRAINDLMNSGGPQSAMSAEDMRALMKKALAEEEEEKRAREEAERLRRAQIIRDDPTLEGGLYDSKQFDIVGTVLKKYNGLDATAKVPKGVTEISYSAFSRSTVTTVILPDSVKSIGNRAFESGYRLANINLPKGLTSIGEHAFHGCHNIKSIELPKGIKTISIEAFAHCDLSSIKIPDGVTSIGEWAFSHCENMTSVEIPNSVTSIDVNSPFYGCGCITSVVIPIRFKRRIKEIFPHVKIGLFGSCKITYI